MSQNQNSNENAELQELKREFTELRFDLQGNTNAILMKPIEMKGKIEGYLKNLDTIAQRLDFLKKTANEGEIFKEIGNLEKEITILKNQIELDLKMITKT